MSTITKTDNSSVMHDALLSKVQHDEPAFVEIRQKNGKTAYAIRDHVSMRTTNYAFATFQRISNEVAHEQDGYKLMEWKEVAETVHQQYQKANENPPSLWRSILLFFHIIHSSDEVEDEFRILKEKIENKYRSASHEPKHLEKDACVHEAAATDKAIDDHRNLKVEVSSYDARALTDKFINPRVKQLIANSNEIKDLDRMIARQKELENSPNPNDKIELEALKKQDPSVKRQIAVARIKEQATREAYENELPKRIQEGFYNPAIIASEIKRVLKVGDAVPSNIRDVAHVKEIIHEELQQFLKEGTIREAQYHYVTGAVDEIVDRYQKVYPGKSLEDTLIFARDLARVAVYQEIFDKSSFSGSDHGSKHIHNNIENAEGLHEHMDKEDYTSKDQFMEHIVHFYHDIGYTVGLATKNFLCSKDHPMVGAKMIEENRAYFEKYLDAESYEVLHKCVLYHAIAVPTLTPSQDHKELDYELVRAVTSISDACAVTYDRKTQEFWEQPRAVRALARLKFFLTQFPSYSKSLAHDNIAKDPWYGLNKDNTLDRIAHDIFQGVKKELHDLVDENRSISEEKRDLFRQAIENQFNGFTANVTLGQYGGVLTGVESLRNPNGIAAGGEGPKYLPKFIMAPSLIYGVLNDLFGEDQANRAFKALCEEFGGNVKDLSSALNAMAKAMSKNEQLEPKLIPTGNAVYQIECKQDIDSHKHHKAHKHLKEMRQSLKLVTTELLEVYGAVDVDIDTKKKLLEDFSQVREGKVALEDYMRGLQALPAQPQRVENMEFLLSDSFKADLRKLQELDRVNKFEADLLYAKMKERVQFALLSDKEIEFMLGIS